MTLKSIFLGLALVSHLSAADAGYKVIEKETTFLGHELVQTLPKGLSKWGLQCKRAKDVKAKTVPAFGLKGLLEFRCSNGINIEIAFVELSGLKYARTVEIGTPDDGAKLSKDKFLEVDNYLIGKVQDAFKFTCGPFQIEGLLRKSNCTDDKGRRFTVERINDTLDPLTIHNVRASIVPKDT